MSLTLILVVAGLVAGGLVSLILVALGIEQMVREYGRTGGPPWERVSRRAAMRPSKN